jgi:type VI secretion system protein ImpA
MVCPTKLFETDYSMPTSPVIDLDRLLTPVSSEQPAGPELKSASQSEERNLYYAVRDARKKAGDAERRVRAFELLTEEERKEEPGSPEPADWEAVSRLSIAALARSKDLWITAWLIEALTRLHGFAGLRDGIRLAHLLCDRFWDDVHPQPTKEEGLTTRFMQLSNLNGADSDGTLVAAVMNVPITAPRTMRPCSCADYKDAAELERKDPKVRSRRVEQGAVTLDMFQRAMAETGVNFFENLLDDLQRATEAVASFTTLLGARVSVKDKASLPLNEQQLWVPPPSSRIRETLDDCLRLCRSLTKDILHREEPGNAGEVGVTAAATEKPDSDGSGVETRQEALRTLLRVSEYFRRTEPHSPVSYALEQAVRWAYMSLPELLSELVADKSTREEIFKRAGIKQESTDK